MCVCVGLQQHLQVNCWWQRQTTNDSGGLALHDHPDEVRQVASRALTLYDMFPQSSGSLRVQPQRFLNPEWKGLSGDETDVPLRQIMEDIAANRMTPLDLASDDSLAAQSFLRWVSNFRFVIS